MGFMDLFRPKWKHSNWRVRAVAVQYLTDQALLVRIAKTDKDSDVRVVAVQNLTDQPTLREIARIGWKSERLAAVNRLTDPATVVEIAKTDKDEQVAIAAVERLADQAALAHIAETAACSRARDYAMVGITDLAVLAGLARTGTDWVSKNSLQRLRHVPGGIDVIIAILKDDRVPASAVLFLEKEPLMAVWERTDIADIAKNARYGPARAAAAKQLVSCAEYPDVQGLLADVARHAADKDVRVAAASVLDDTGTADAVIGEVLSQVVADSADPLRDHRNLIETALSCQHFGTPRAELQKFFVQVAESEDFSLGVREGAANKIADGRVRGEIQAVLRGIRSAKAKAEAAAAAEEAAERTAMLNRLYCPSCGKAVGQSLVREAHKTYDEGLYSKVTYSCKQCGEQLLDRPGGTVAERTYAGQ